MEPSIFRILDANRNRASEAARVVEEFFRFVRNDPARTREIKEIRHDLRALFEQFQSHLPTGCSWETFRDTRGDVGTEITIESELHRRDPRDVALASLKRLEEALRVIEEYGKLLCKEVPQKVEAIRYRVYEIERRLTLETTRHSRLHDALLYVLVTEHLASADFLTTAREVVAGGADIVQMREKELEDGAFLDRAVQIGEICRAKGVIFLVNDRPHIALLADADGVHTGWGDLPIALARRVAGMDRIVGRSTAAPEWAERAIAEGADYIGIGPVYPTKTKEHREAVGLEYVRWAARNVTIPFFCIGSINRETLPKVLDAGARAVAICTAIIGARDIAAETAWFKAKLQERHSALPLYLSQP